jgi:hypothetical protein
MGRFEDIEAQIMRDKTNAERESRNSKIVDFCEGLSEFQELVLLERRRNELGVEAAPYDAQISEWDGLSEKEDGYNPSATKVDAQREGLIRETSGGLWQERIRLHDVVTMALMKEWAKKIYDAGITNRIRDENELYGILINGSKIIRKEIDSWQK